ncbi:MAG: DUF386 domain-containing protein [Opitutaceae bacterium]|nr:DUF386 domain-containing protein [Opitutaceae bacterium]
MIIDRLTHAKAYTGLGPRFAKAFAYLALTDLDKLPVGRFAIEGDNLFALVSDGPTKPRDQCRYEAHLRYHDIQLVTHGEELMGYAPVEDLLVVQPFRAGNDYAFFEGIGTDFQVRAGMFAVFMPQDGHRPSMAIDQPQRVRKVVLKVAV